MNDINLNDTNMIEVFLQKRLIGKLALTQDGLCAFQYDVDYIQNGVSISPFKLPFSPELQIAARQPFDGGFGVFDDSLPDGWGRLVMDRYIRSNGVDVDRISVLQRLSLIGSSGRGALEYKPDSDLDIDDGIFSFSAFAKIADEILTSGNEGSNALETMYRYSGSSGGARPKAFVKIDNREWLIKYKSSGDSEDIGRTEYNYSLLAKKCGIRMPNTRLFEDKFFGTERFDRTPDGKVHIISAAALLGADYRMPSLDYRSLLNACRLLTQNMQEVEELFKVMVFNVTIKNRDDHAKNFSFMLDQDQWKLAPAYDLLPAAGFNGYHTTTVNGSGNPDETDILAVAKDVGLSQKTAREIIDRITETCNSVENKDIFICDSES